MEFNFKIREDTLVAGSVLSGNAGNVKTYICNFDIVDNVEFTWLCVFKKNGKAYQQVIDNGRCVIPKEVLEDSGAFEIGCYGTYGDKRISTNWLEFNTLNGAYCEATMPQEPTPDVWETLVMNSIPYIGETGNWYVYDKEKRSYVDSGMPSTGEKGEKGDTGSKGEDGYTPQRGVDYWTQEDRNAVKSELEEDLNFEERLASTVGSYGNALKGKISGAQVVINDVSPVEHEIDVKLRSKNLIPYPYYNTSKTVDGITWTDNGDGTVTANGTATTTTSFTLQNNSVSPFKLEIGKSYIVSGLPENTDASTGYRLVVQSTDFSQNIEGKKAIVATRTEYYAFIRLEAGTVCDNITFKPQLEEGTAITEYTPFVDVQTVTVSRYGQNLWDEEWEIKNNNHIASKNFVPVLPGADYCLYCVSHTTTSTLPANGFHFYDKNFAKISTIYPANKQKITTPENCYFIKFELGAVYGTAYKNDICFNVYDKRINGSYKKYAGKKVAVSDTDGKVKGITALFPVITLVTDKNGIIVNCGYNRDINKVYEELTNAIISLGGNV